MTDLFRSDPARPSYDPNRIYLASTDGHGHYRQTKLIFPPDIASRVAEAVESSRSPYRSRQDLYRDAVVHRLQWVAENLEVSEDFRQWVGELTARSIIETTLTMSSERKSGVEACWKLLATGAPEAKAAVLTYVTALPDCPERDQLASRL